MNKSFPLTLYYDGDCRFCLAEMRNLELRDVGARLRFVNIATSGPEVYPSGTDRNALMTLIHARSADGTIIRGMEVFRLAYTAVGLPWVARLTSLPLLGRLCDVIYPVIARNRYRLPGRPIDWLFGVALNRAARAQMRRLRCNGECRVPAAEDHSCSEERVT